MKDLPPDAEILLLILASNGGSMDRDDANREFRRVKLLGPEDFTEWKRRAVALAQQHAERILHGKDFV